MLKLRTTILAAAMVLAASAAQAVTLDFTGAASRNARQIAQTYGDTTLTDVSYRILNGGDNWGLAAIAGVGTPLYRATNTFSGDNAIYARTGSKLEVKLDAAPGYRITNVSFRLGSLNSRNRRTNFRVFDVAGTLLQSGINTRVPGAGLIVALNITSPSIVFQLGDVAGVGLRDIVYTVTPVPLPGALPLLATGICGVGVLSRRRKALK